MYFERPDQSIPPSICCACGTWLERYPVSGDLKRHECVYNLPDFINLSEYFRVARSYLVMDGEREEDGSDDEAVHIPKVSGACGHCKHQWTIKGATRVSHLDEE